MGIHDRLQETARQVRQAYHGESFALRRAGVPGTTVVYGVVMEHQRDQRPKREGEVSMERRWIQFKKDESTELWPGIGQITRGDSLWRDGDSMSDRYAWSYTGEAKDVSGTTWTLQFERAVLQHRGGPR